MEKSNINSEEIKIRLKEKINNFLKNDPHYHSSILGFFSQIISEFFSSNKQSFLSFFLSLTSEKKSIIFLRHGESDYNLWRSKFICNLPFFYQNKPSNYDPKLTETGNIQAEEAINSMLSYLQEKTIDIVYVSPLTRALQTCMKIHKSLKKNKSENLNILASDLIRERMDFPCDVGSKKKLLEERFGEVDFQYISNEVWWRYNENTKDCNEENKEKIKSESKKNVYLRVLLFVLWVLVNEENNILIVSHQNVYQCLFNNYNIFGLKIKNCEFKKLTHKEMTEFLTKATQLLK